MSSKSNDPHSNHITSASRALRAEFDKHFGVHEPVLNREGMEIFAEAFSRSAHKDLRGYSRNLLVYLAEKIDLSAPRLQEIYNGTSPMQVGEFNKIRNATSKLIPLLH